MRVFIWCLVLARAQALTLGVYGPLTSYSQQHIAAVAAFDLDLRKNFDDELRQRFGAPVIEIPNLQPEVANISVHMGTSHSQQELGVATSLDLLLGAEGEAVVGLVGGVYSSIAVNVATLSAALKVPQIGFGCTSPLLSNKDTYPYFLRTVPPDIIQAKAFWAWMVLFEVPLAACLYSLEPYGEGLFRAIQDEANRAGEPGRLSGVPLPAGDDFLPEEVAAALTELRSFHTKFILLALTSRITEHLLPLAEEQGLLGTGVQILASEAGILFDRLPLGFMQWRPVNVGPKFGKFLGHWSKMRAEDVISEAARARYKIDSFRVPLEQALVPNITDATFSASDVEVFTPFLFDALYCFVFAINSLLLKGHDFEAIRGALLLSELATTEFEGISGPVNFDANLDREAAYYELMNFQVTGPEVAGVFSAASGRLTTESMYWMTGKVSEKAPEVLGECGPGLYQHELSKKCEECPRGFFCEMQSQKQCPRGSFSNVTGAAACDLCPKGRFSSDLGATKCFSCLPGSFAETDGMEACERCPKGRYAPSADADSCLECGMGQETAERGSQSSSECRCAGSFFMCNSSSAGLGCKPCPKGLLCEAGLASPVQMSSYWASQDGAASCNFNVLSCRNALQCPGGSPLGECAEGRLGTACNNCRVRYFPMTDGTCSECTAFDFFPSIGFIVIAALLFLMLARFLRGAERVSTGTLTVAAVGGQMVVAVQSLGSIRQLSIRWVEPVAHVVGWSQIVSFDLDLVKISCLYGQDSPLMKLVGQLLVCPAGLALLACSWLLSRLRGQRLSIDMLFNLCGSLVFALLISITLAVLDPFQCVMNPDGSSSMSSNPGIRCFQSSEHLHMVVLASVGILCYPVSVISWATYTTLKYPSRIRSGAGLQLVHRHRFLFQRFKPERYYYGLLLLNRSALLALVPSVLSAFPALQLELMGVILIIASCVQVRLWPWRTRLSNYTDLTINCLLQVLFLGVAPLTDNSQAVSTGMLGWVLVVAVLSPVVFGFMGISYALWRYLRPPTRFGMFLCHHKSAAGSLCRLLKLLVSQHSSTRVFLDSDQLEDLDLIFETVRKTSRNVVAVLTPELLKRMWCAGELVTAFKNKVRTVPLACDGYQPPFAELLSHVEEFWTVQQKQLLFNHGISMEDVRQTYGWLQSLEGLELQRSGQVEDLELTVVELLHWLKLPRNLFQTSLAEAHRVKARILITGQVSDMEALATLDFFQILVLRRMQKECVVVRSSREVLAYKPWAYYMVVLLSRGILTDPRFAQTLLSAYLGESDRQLELVAVMADATFQFPRTAFLRDIAEKGLGSGNHIISPSLGPELAMAYRSLLSVLTLPLSPWGSEGLLEQQVQEISLRFRRYRLKHGTLLDSQDDLKVPGDGVDPRTLRGPEREFPEFSSEMKRKLFGVHYSVTWMEDGQAMEEEVCMRRSLNGLHMGPIEEVADEGWNPDSLQQMLQLQSDAIGVGLVDIDEEDVIEM